MLVKGAPGGLIKLQLKLGPGCVVIRYVDVKHLPYATFNAVLHDPY